MTHISKSAVELLNSRADLRERILHSEKVSAIDLRLFRRASIQLYGNPSRRMFLAAEAKLLTLPIPRELVISMLRTLSLDAKLLKV